MININKAMSALKEIEIDGCINSQARIKAAEEFLMNYDGNKEMMYCVTKFGSYDEVFRILPITYIKGQNTNYSRTSGYGNLCFFIRPKGAITKNSIYLIEASIQNPSIDVYDLVNRYNKHKSIEVDIMSKIRKCNYDKNLWR